MPQRFISANVCCENSGFLPFFDSKTLKFLKILLKKICLIIGWTRQSVSKERSSGESSISDKTSNDLQNSRPIESFFFIEKTIWKRKKEILFCAFFSRQTFSTNRSISDGTAKMRPLTTTDQTRTFRRSEIDSESSKSFSVFSPIETSKRKRKNVEKRESFLRQTVFRQFVH